MSKYGNAFLQGVFEDTQKIVENTQEFKISPINTMMCYIKDILGIEEVGGNKVIVTVDNIDCVEKTRQFSELGRTCLLNMASFKKPGGGVRNGSRAQEEEICRRSNLVFHLDPMSYPISYDKYIYTQDVAFFKNGKYEAIDPFYADVVTVAAVNLNGNLTKPEDYEHIMRNKINAIFNEAYFNSVDNLVLSAFGCGVYNNDPTFIATLFKEAITKYGNYFDRISFAILNDHNSVGNNFDIFKKVIL